MFMFGMPCVRCNHEIIAPQETELLAHRVMRHLWNCPKCKARFESFPRFPKGAKLVRDVMKSVQTTARQYPALKIGDLPFGLMAIRTLRCGAPNGITESGGVPDASEIEVVKWRLMKKSHFLNQWQLTRMRAEKDLNSRARSQGRRSTGSGRPFQGAWPSDRSQLAFEPSLCEPQSRFPGNRIL